MQQVPGCDHTAARCSGRRSFSHLLLLLLLGLLALPGSGQQ
jgi:hypothetical protein